MYTKKIDNVSVCYCCCALTPAGHQAVFALLSLLRGAATDHTVQHGSCSLRLYERKFDGNGTYELSSADTAATEDDIKKKNVQTSKWVCRHFLHVCVRSEYTKRT
uniref:Uncharacterized protein n=1 Tax=Sipha flava TaxID=143950 RepID=A0A2S2Q8S2_9HEMI